MLQGTALQESISYVMVAIDLWTVAPTLRISSLGDQIPEESVKIILNQEGLLEKGDDPQAWSWSLSMMKKSIPCFVRDFVCDRIQVLQIIISVTYLHCKFCTVQSNTLTAPCLLLALVLTAEHCNKASPQCEQVRHKQWCFGGELELGARLLLSQGIIPGPAGRDRAAHPLRKQRVWVETCSFVPFHWNHVQRLVSKVHADYHQWINISGKVVGFADALVCSSFFWVTEAFFDKVCHTWLFPYFWILAPEGMLQIMVFSGNCGLL